MRFLARRYKLPRRHNLRKGEKCAPARAGHSAGPAVPASSIINHERRELAARESARFIPLAKLTLRLFIKPLAAANASARARGRARASITLKCRGVNAVKRY